MGIALLVLLLWIPTGPVHAQQSPDITERAFNGSFTEFSLRGGPALNLSDTGTGWMADAGFRNSFPFYLGDNRLSYRYTGVAEADSSLQIHSIHAALALHPFYLALLSEGFISHFLASLHLEIGFGPQLGLRSYGGDQDSQFGIAASLGTGFDLPLMNADSGQALWLNFLYRRTWTTVSFALQDSGQRLHDHGIFLGLSWRINGTIWRD